MDATLTVDTSPLSQIDRRFFAVLIISMMVHALAATWVARQPHVAENDTYDDRLDRFVKAPLLPIPRVFPPVKVAPAPGGPPSPAPRPPRPGPNRPSGTPAALSGLVATAIGEFTGQQSDADQALIGVQKGNVDTTLLARRRDAGPNQAQQIGNVVTRGVKQVGIGEHQDAPAVPGRADDPVVETNDVTDPSAFTRYIVQHKTALVACYERELKHRPTLRGRVTVHLTVDTEGRAREVAVNDETLSSPAVAECLVTMVRRWTFPVKPEDPAALQFPVLFWPAG